MSTVCAKRTRRRSGFGILLPLGKVLQSPVILLGEAGDELRYIVRGALDGRPNPDALALRIE
jgi:hypothetical protein